MTKKPTFYVLTPRDGFFCKDGRGWFTDGEGRARSLDWPMPTTVLGALRTAWGRGQEKKSGSVLSPAQWRQVAGAVGLDAMIALRRPLKDITRKDITQKDITWDVSHRMWPCPADALMDESGHLIRLECRESSDLPPTLPAGDDPEAQAIEALWRPGREGKGKVKPGPRWWTDAMFLDWLMGTVPRDTVPRDTESRGPSRRAEVKLALNPSSATAANSMLYVEEVVETLEAAADGVHEWAMGCRVLLESAALPCGHRAPLRPVTFGGGQRPACLSPISKDSRNPKAAPDIFRMPEKLREAVRENRPRLLRLIAVTPLSFERGWLPDGCQVDDGCFAWTLPSVGTPVWLRAALVPRPQHVSGWDMVENRPKDTIRLVPPGSVYVVERRDGKPFGHQEVEALWFSSLGGGTDEGFGLIVPGLG